MDRWTNKWTDRWTNRQMDEQMYGQMDGQTDGKGRQMDEWADGWTGRLMEQLRIFSWMMGKPILCKWAIYKCGLYYCYTINTIIFSRL